jgi:GNAT superfamily N-acetyltransferase
MAQVGDNPLPEIRGLTEADVPAACRLTFDAGWNRTEGDWRRLVTLEPEACLGIDADGRLVATTTLLGHDQTLAWLGMVVTDPAYRKRGFATALVEAALALADGREIGAVRLDASDQGRPLYLALGFEAEQPVERWRLEAAPAEPPAPEPGESSDGAEPDEHRPALAAPRQAGLDGGSRETGPAARLPRLFDVGPPDLALDLAAFGADRSRLLEALGPALRFGSGFLMHRPGSRARQLGPCVARHSREAEAAIRAVLAAYPGERWMWDLVPANAGAVEIARRLGFAPIRHLTRMRRGAPVAGDDRLVYALAGFEAG